MKRTQVKLFVQVPDDDGQMIEVLQSPGATKVCMGSDRGAELPRGTVLARESRFDTWRIVGRVDPHFVPLFEEYADER